MYVPPLKWIPELQTLLKCLKFAWKNLHYLEWRHVKCRFFRNHWFLPVLPSASWALSNEHRFKSCCNVDKQKIRDSRKHYAVEACHNHKETRQLRSKTSGNEIQSWCTAGTRRNCNAWNKNSLEKQNSSHKPKTTTICCEPNFHQKQNFDSFIWKWASSRLLFHGFHKLLNSKMDHKENNII